MSMESQVFNALTGLVAGRVYPDFAPEGVARPYITYQAVGGAPINFLDSATIPNKEKARVQISVWADTRLDATVLGKSVENTMRAAAMQVEVATGRVATFDETTSYRGTRQDFYVFT